MKRLFFSQSMLDSMAEAGRIRIDGDTMTLLAGDNPAFVLLPAYRIVRAIDNGPDPAGLTSEIRSEAELREMGADIYMDSVIYRDTAYQADPGFIAEQRGPGVRAKDATAPAAESNASAQPAAGSPEDPAKNGDELSKFILDNLL